MVSPPPAVVDVPAFGALPASDIPTGPRAAAISAPSGPRGRLPSNTWRAPQANTEAGAGHASAGRTPSNPSPSPIIPTGPSSSSVSVKTVKPISLAPTGPPPEPPLLPSQIARKKFLKDMGMENGRLRVLGPTSLQTLLQESLEAERSDSESEDEDELDHEYFEGELIKAERELQEFQAWKELNRGPSSDTLQEIAALLEAEDAAATSKTMEAAQDANSASTLVKEEQLNAASSSAASAASKMEVDDDPPLVANTISTNADALADVGEKGKGRVAALMDASRHIDDASPSEAEAEEDKSSQSARKLVDLIQLPSYQDLDESDAEYQDELEAMRTCIRTPPVSSLPYHASEDPHSKLSNGSHSGLVDTQSIWDSNAYVAGAPDPLIMQAMMVAMLRKQENEREDELDAQDIAAQEWKTKYKEWRAFHRSNDPEAIANRARWERKKALKLPTIGRTTPLPEARLEGRRNQSRFASAADVDIVLELSRMEVEEEKTKREKKELAASKEAKVPDMYTPREREVHMFEDTSGLVMPERAVKTFEVVPVDLKFTDEEFQIFMQAIRRTPKKFVKIAEHLPGRTYKDCIQYYYQIKHSYDIRSMIEAVQHRRKPGPKKKQKPKASALTADLHVNDGDEGADVDENRPKSPRPRRAAAPVNFDKNANRSDIEAPPATVRKPRAKQTDASGEGKVTKRRAKGDKPDKPKKQARNGQPGTPVSVSRATSKSRDEPTPKSFTPVPPPQPHSAFNPAWQAANPAFDRPMIDPYYAQPVVAPPPVPDIVAQSYVSERIDTIPPQVPFDSQQTHRGLGSQTSSYWSVPEVNDFPALLAHFGTDWTAISKHMQSKTLIMVYSTVFQPWLTMPKDSNKSRRITNLEKQVKNYYQRQVHAGKTDWERIALEADAKRARGESTGPAPVPSMPATTGRAPQRITTSGMDNLEDQGGALGTAAQANVAARTSTPPFPNPRYPTLAQAIPTTVVKAGSSEPGSSKHTIQQQQSMPQTARSQPPASKPPRGPQLGFFDTSRPILKATHSHTPPAQLNPKDPGRSERSIMVAREAEKEQAEAIQRLEQQRALDQQRLQQQYRAEQREQREQMEQRDQQRQELQRMEQQRMDQLVEQQRIAERRHSEEQRAEQQRMEIAAEQQRARYRLKQESEGQTMSQYEPYSSQALQQNVLPSGRKEAIRSQPQTDASRSEQVSFRADSTGMPYRYDDRYERASESARPVVVTQPYAQRDMRSVAPHAGPSTSAMRNAMSATPVHLEPPRPPPSAPSAAATTQKKSNIMSLLNDEPTESKQTQSKPATPLIQPSHSPALRESMYQPPPRHNSVSAPRQYQPQAHQPQSQPSPYSIPSQPHRPMMQQVSPHLSASQPHPAYGQSVQQTHNSGPPSRSYTPNHYESSGYAPPTSVRREASIGESHGHQRGAPSGSHALNPSGMRHPLNESPYSTSPAASATRQVTSPMERHAVEATYARGPGYMTQSMPQYAEPRGDPRAYSDVRQRGYHEGPQAPSGPASYSAQQRQEQEHMQQQQARLRGSGYGYEGPRMDMERDRWERERQSGNGGYGYEAADMRRQQMAAMEEDRQRREYQDRERERREMELDMERRRGGR